MQFHLKRSLETGGDDIRGYELPSWAFLIFLADLIVFIPFVLIINYTFKCVYPIFAMVEDENPPAYEPLSLDDSETAPHNAEDGVARNGFKPTNGQARTVTSSFRAINRLLMANGGFKANFRGFFCAAAQAALTSILMGIFTGALGKFFVPIATLLASLTLVQFSTAWVHIIISEKSPLHFWSRLPPFRRTFDATWKAVTLFWFAAEVTRFVPIALALTIGLKVPKGGFGEPMDVTDITGAMITKGVVVTIVAIVCSVFLIVPASVILVRVQASLLPVELNTIIPFDRSFEGQVEPEVVGGKGYATITDAWSTFSKAAWRRLLTLYVKIFLVTLAGLFVFAAVLVPEAIIIGKHTREIR